MKQALALSIMAQVVDADAVATTSDVPRPAPATMSHAHDTIEYRARAERGRDAFEFSPISDVDQSLTADAWFDKKEDEAHAQRI